MTLKFDLFSFEVCLIIAKSSSLFKTSQEKPLDWNLFGNGVKFIKF